MANITAGNYLIPPAEAQEQMKLGFLKEMVSDGEAFLKSQAAYKDIDLAVRMMNDRADERIPKSLSRVKVNPIKRNINEIVATLSNLRPMWGYHTDNSEYQQNAANLNKLILAWWYNAFPDRAIREALQYAAVEGTGYASPFWERNFWCYGRGDIALGTYGAKNVIPYQIGKDHDIQRAYAVTMVQEVPLVQAWAMYPKYADKIKADREQASWIRRGLDRVQKFVAPALRAAGSAQSRDESVPYPTVDIYNTYVLDYSVNETDHVIPMGDPGTSWYYEVPYIGADIPTGQNNSAGQALYRKATDEDARLYPLRRLITWTASCQIYDNTSYWWHGMVPAVQFRMDDWPWEFLGFSMVRDNKSMQDSMIQLLRAMDDSANARLRPPLQYDKDTIPKSFMERFDPRQSGQTVGLPLSMGEPIKPVVPADYYNIPAQCFELVKDYRSMIDNQMGVNDITAIAKARQIPSGESIEKIMELAGPLMTDKSRNMERSLRQLGEMVKGLFFQFYTTPRKLQILGEDAITPEEWDYDPGNMVPSHLPGEDKSKASRFNMVQRARWHMNNFVFQVTPNSLHQITQITRKLMYIQLKKSGFPIDWWTEAEVFDIANFGPPPKGANTVMQRYIAQLRLMAELQQAVAPPVPPNPVGRPPSGQKPPHIVQKDQGTRSTISES